jgi:hypothetical protein
MRGSKRAVSAAALTCALVMAGCGGGGGGESSDLALGEEAVVQHADTEADATPTTLGVTVLTVRQGTQQELEDGDFKLDPDEQELTPYYVDARFENQGTQTIDRRLRPGLEDGDGNLINATTIISLGGPPFEKCPQPTEGQLESGQTYESCTLFLVEEGREPDRASFLPYVPGEETDFVYWDATGTEG